jgi:hypothetical protein
MTQGTTTLKSSTLTPSPATLFEDNFENGTARWMSYDAYWEIRVNGTNHFYCVKPPTPDKYSYADAGSLDWKDYALELDIMLVKPSAQNVAFVAVRAMSQYSYQYTYQLSREKVDLSKLISPDPNKFQWLAGNPQIMEYEKWFSVRIDARGQNLLYALNKKLILQQADPSIQNGKIRIGTVPGGEVCFDNVRVIALEGAK